MKYRLNVLEQRKNKDNCCGGNGPNCKCSSTKQRNKTSREERRNKMVDFFMSMNRNFIDKK